MSRPKAPEPKPLSDMYRMRVSGKTLREIAEATGLTITQVNNAITKDLEETAKAREDLRLIELIRLEEMHALCGDIIQKASEKQDWPIVLSTIDRILKIMERRAKYAALDTINVKIDTTTPDPELVYLLAEAARIIEHDEQHSKSGSL